MPLPFFFSSAGVGAYFGLQYTRFKGVILSGDIGSTMAGPIEGPAGIALIQPALVCSTAGQAAQLLSTTALAANAANFVYITQATGAVGTSSDAGTGSTAAPPQTAMGAALLWQGAGKKLAIYSTASGVGTWFYSAAFTSSV